VTVDELVAGIGVALGDLTLDACQPLDDDGSGDVDVAEILGAINRALAGC
jgi:hypothetical protein